MTKDQLNDLIEYLKTFNWVPDESECNECLLVCGGRPLFSVAATSQSAEAVKELPYVYTQWEQLTTRTAFPMITSLQLNRSKRDCVWIGTEDGLARLDKKTRK
jgi:hypothetical protein